MKLKKINAFLSLLTILAIFVHVGYIVFAYLTFQFDPMIKNLTARPFMALACLHAILAMGILFFSSDGTRLSQYPKQNVTTILQRVTAILMIPFLILHIKAFDLLNVCAEAGNGFGFALLIAAQVFFYGITFIHVAVSLTRGLITLGWLSSMEKKRIIDRIIRIVCAIFFLVAAFAVIKGILALAQAGGAK